MELRLYSPQDAPNISELLSSNTPYLRNEEFWIWINRVLSEDSIVAVAESMGKIVGHYAVIPRIIKISDLKLKAGIGIHALISPAYRDQLSIFQISTLVYEEARRKGFDLIYGFPNSNYRLIQERIERWKKISVFRTYECSKASINQKNIVGTTLEIVNLLDFSQLYQLNDALECTKRTSTIYLETNASYWLRRYFLHPQKPYEIIKVLYHGVQGFFVIKKYLKNGIRYTHIIDYTYNISQAVLKGFLITIFNYYSETTDVFSAWKGDRTFEKTINDLGFVDNGFDTFFGVKILSDKAKSLESSVCDFSNWRLVMGDSDAF